MRVSWLANRWGGVVFAFCLLSILPLIIAIITQYGLWFDREAPPAIIKYVRDTKGIDIRVREVTVDWFMGGVTLHGFELYDKLPGQPRIAYADKVMVRRLFTEVISIKVLRPKVALIQGADGVWNIKRALPFKKGKPGIKVYKITVDKADLYLEMRKKRVVPAVLNVFNIDANILNTSGITTFGVSSSQGASKIKALGNICVQGVVVNYAVTHWPAATFKEFISSKLIESPDAILSTEGRVWFREGQYQVQGTGGVIADTFHLRLNNRMQSLGPISGSVQYDKQHVTLQAKHAIAGGSANTSVNISWSPVLVVTGNLDGRRIIGSRLSNQLGLAATIPQFGRTSGQVRFSFNHQRGLVLSGPLTFDGFSWMGYRAAQGKTYVSYENNVIKIADGKFAFNKANVRLDGIIPLKAGKMHLYATSSDFNLSSAHLPRQKSVLTGKAQVSADITGSVNKPKAELRIQATQVAYRRMVARRVNVMAYVDKDQVDLRALWIKTQTGRVWASGVYKYKAHDINAKFGVEGVPLSDAMKTAGLQAGVNGTAFCTGRITGKISKPAMNARLMVLDIGYKDWHLDMLSVHAKVTNGVLMLTQGSGRRTMGVVRWSGKIGGIYTKSPQADMQAYFSNWDISELAGMAAPDKPVEKLPDGLIKAEVKMIGPLLNPSVTMRMTSNNITYDDINLRDVVLDAAYGDRMLRIYQVSGRLPDGELNASGVVRDAGDYSVDGQFSGLALRVLRRYLPKQLPQDIAGQAKADFRLVARDNGPELTANVELSNMSWDGLSIELSKGTVKVANGRIRIENLGADAYGGRVEAPQIEYDITTKRIRSVIQMRDLDVAELSDAIVSGQWINRQWPEARKTIKEVRPLAGKVSFTTNVDGELGKLDVYASLKARDVTVRGVDGLNAEVGYRLRPDGSMQVKPLSVSGKDVNLSGDLQATAAGELSGRVTLQDFNMKRLQVALPETTEVDGVANAVAVLGGNFKSPSGTLEFNIEQPSWGGIRLKKIIAEPISLAGGSVEIPNVTIMLEGGQATLSGHLTLAPKSLSWTDTSTVDLKLVAPKQPLSSLTSLFEMPKSVAVKGEWQASISVLGTSAKPQLAGGLSISDCSITMDDGKLGLQKMAASLNLDGQEIRLTNATAEPISGSGLVKLEAVASGVFGKQPQIESKLTLAKLVFDQRNLSKQFNERIRGEFDGSLEMKGSVRQPHISGTITSNKFMLALPNGFEFAQSSSKPGFDPFFDNVQAVIVDNAEIDLSRFKAVGGGRMSLNGKLSEPQLRGDFRLRQGRIILPTTVFRIEPPAVVTMAYPVPGAMPFNLDVSMRATASVSVASNGRNPSRHTVTMVLQGPLEDSSLMHSNFEASPSDVSQADIYDALGLGMIRNVVGGGGGNALGNGVVDLLSSQFVPQLFNPIESGLESTLRLDDVRIDYQRDLPLSVMLVKQLGSNFSLSYWRQFESHTDRYEVKLSYDLPQWLKISPRLRLTVSTNEESIISYGLEGSFRF
ncbi:MAG: translocation/assembly module TamB domain-containing protein [Armatimonadota bacterium]